ncbi:MAG: glycosyltransferase family 52 [Clostridiales bacterium]|nr:glycosyltransferase family 52 protein [Roseburia sp.]MDD7636307.1 glycosyltransferase family 52 [Clostridiales bacterium]MDY4112619.1 glycosyltransferase family 52 [Roseburia sp.]
MKEQKVFIIGSPYGLLVSLLLYSIEDNDVFVFNGDVISARIVDKLKETNTVFIRNSNSTYAGKFGKAINTAREWKRYKNFIRRNISNDARIVGHDHIFAISFPFWGSFETIIEDGYINYLPYNDILSLMKKNGLRYFRILNKIYKRKNKREYKLYGYDESVKNVYLTDVKKKAPKLLTNVYVNSISELWKKLNSDLQQKLQSIFMVDSIWLKLHEYQEIVFLITQPLSEDGLMAEEEKIRVYSEVLKGNENKVLVKPHPREKTDYKKYFPDAQIIDNDVPMEMIALSFDNICRVYTCFSTSASIFDGRAEIKYISLMEFPEIVKKYNLFHLYK